MEHCKIECFLDKVLRGAKRKMEKFEHNYGAEQIQVLEGLEAVRKRPRNVYRKRFCKRPSSFSIRNSGQWCR